MPQSARLVLNQANLRACVAAFAGRREAPGASAAAVPVGVETLFICAQITAGAAHQAEEGLEASRGTPDRCR